MAVPTTAFAGAGSGAESRRSPRSSEFWTVTGGAGGSADGDQATITPRYMKTPQLVNGAVSFTISGQVVTITLITTLAAGEIVAVEVVGYPG